MPAGFVGLPAKMGGCGFRVVRRACLIAGLFSMSLVVCSQADTTPSAQTSASGVPELPPDKAQADFDFMIRALAEAHPALNRYSPKTELDREFAAERVKLDHSMTKLEL